MSGKQVLCDKQEIIFTARGQKGYEDFVVTNEKIRMIQFDKCIENKLWRKIPSEKITVITSGKTFEYTKLKSEPYFEEYKEALQKFAQNNRITLVSNL